MNLTIDNTSCEEIIFTQGGVSHSLDKLYYGQNLVWEKIRETYKNMPFTCEGLTSTETSVTGLDSTFYIRTATKTNGEWNEYGSWAQYDGTNNKISNTRRIQIYHNGNLCGAVNTGSQSESAATKNTRKLRCANDWKIYGNIYSLTYGLDYLNGAKYVSADSNSGMNTYATGQYYRLFCEYTKVPVTISQSDTNTKQAVMNFCDDTNIWDETGNPSNHTLKDAGGLYIGLEMPFSITANSTCQQADHTCEEMFFGCTELVHGPILDFTTLGDYDCYRMFANCCRMTDINHQYGEIDCYFATTAGNSYHHNLKGMFYYCASLEKGINEILLWNNPVTKYSTRSGRQYYDWGLGTVGNSEWNGLVETMYAGCFSLKQLPKIYFNNNSGTAFNNISLYTMLTNSAATTKCYVEEIFLYQKSSTASTDSSNNTVLYSFLERILAQGYNTFLEGGTNKVKIHLGGGLTSIESGTLSGYAEVLLDCPEG